MSNQQSNLRWMQDALFSKDSAARKVNEVPDWARESTRWWGCAKRDLLTSDHFLDQSCNRHFGLIRAL
jgi:hypothetical protein